RATNGEIGDVVFMALDDYLVAFAARSSAIGRRLRRHRLWSVKYRVEYLFRRKNRWLRNLALNWLTRWSLFRSHAGLVCFDERLHGKSIAGRSVIVVPDPWFGDFDVARRAAARAKHGFADGDFVILLLGRQDRRKGIHL